MKATVLVYTDLCAQMERDLDLTRCADIPEVLAGQSGVDRR